MTERDGEEISTFGIGPTNEIQQEGKKIAHVVDSYKGLGYIAGAYAMKTTRKAKLMTAAEFAEAMEYDYTTIIRWLRKGIVPGATFDEVIPGMSVWRIPESALKMEKPRPGRKRKAGEKKGK